MAAAGAAPRPRLVRRVFLAAVAGLLAAPVRASGQAGGRIPRVGSLSYGVNFPDLYPRTASYIDRILKGARPGDLPIERPTTFELALNLKTARALGLAIPPALLQRANHVVQ